MTVDAGMTGGCQCGAVRYRLNAVPENPHICHCRMCQKAAGNYFMPLGRVLKSDLTVTRGEIAWYASSDAVRRGFCAKCGTPLAYENLKATGVSVTLGSLDDPAAVKPSFEAGPEARISWFGDLDTLPPEDGDPTPWYEVVAPSNHQHPDHDTESWPAQNESKP